MSKCGKASITSIKSRAKDYTKVTFLPDYKRFQSIELEQDTYDLLCRRVYDIAGATHLSLKVHLNNQKLEVDRFENYVDMYIRALHNTSSNRVNEKSDKDMSTESSIDSDWEDDAMSAKKDSKHGSSEESPGNFCFSG